ncbi:hypothetical protein [Yoonia algicola]|uniref:Uncharacterized protein n=1 Tax=Yoonia algicola TaxID=3137368 RepID=A0AAN0M6I9_9RHOB
MTEAICRGDVTKHLFCVEEVHDDCVTAVALVWLVPKLERALTDQLINLAETYGETTRENPDTTTENVSDLVQPVEQAAVTQNVLCHGSWRTPNGRSGSILGQTSLRWGNVWGTLVVAQAGYTGTSIETL